MEDIKPQTQLDEQIKAGEFSRSHDWKIVKKRLFDKLLELDSLSIIYEQSKSKTIKSLGEKAFVNGKVCKIIIEWISEIEADGETLEENQIALKDMKHDIIYRTE
jgi:hypothetical protein